MKKKTTIYDIAEALNVTISTVSRALSGFPAISDTTRSAVIEMAKKLNYTPNKLASALKSGRTNIIGVIVPSVQAQFFASVIHSVEEVLKDNGYRVILYQSNESIENEISGVRTLLEAQVDGIIASMSLETNVFNHFEEVIKQNKPLVLFDRVHKSLKVPTVTLDDFKAGYLATEYLIKQGYKKIAFITTEHQIEIFDDRLKGYKAALLKSNLNVSDDLIIYGDLSIQAGKSGTIKLMKGKNKPDAIIGGDDFTALGIIKKLKELGETPPKIGVIGFANETFSDYITPSLSTIDQHANKMGSTCADVFLKMIKEANPYQNVEHVVIKPTLIERESTRKND